MAAGGTSILEVQRRMTCGAYVQVGAGAWGAEGSVDSPGMLLLRSYGCLLLVLIWLVRNSLGGGPPGMLTVEQQKRSIRLLHILRQTFAGHDRSSLILQNYVEGAASYQQSGFVALRLLSKEFCLKSRSECLYFRSQLANQMVKAPTIPEIVRKIESEQHKYSKLLSSLDPDVQSQGLEVQEADLVMVLLRSLPERCRSYCLLHGDGDSFEDLKRVALKYEVQQRVWSEGPGTKSNPFKPDGKGKDGDEKGASKGKGKKGKKRSKPKCF